MGKFFIIFSNMLLFYVTYPDEATARQISGALLAQKLIACYNLFPVASAYWWQGALQQDNEWVGLLKTVPEMEPSVEAAIRAIHPYETPCLMRLTVPANPDYEKWIRENIQAV